MNAQLVWREFELHMTMSSKGKAEKCRLCHYVTTPVLDRSWKGTTEQFALHFNEQFRQLDEVSPANEILPYPARLELIQTDVNAIPELRVVETMEEFLNISSYFTCSTLDNDGYFTLLQNACIRHDKGHKSTLSAASRAIYQHNSQDYHPSSSTSHETTDSTDTGTITGGTDMSTEDFYHVHNTHSRKLHPIGFLIPKMHLITLVATTPLHPNQ